MNFIDRARNAADQATQQAQNLLASEVARWTKVVRDENIPPQ